MRTLAASLCGLALLAAVASPGFAFQEYPSLEVAPYVGYLLYDSNLTHYSSNLDFGVRLDLRTMEMLGFQFNYAISGSTVGFPGIPFGKNSYVERIQFNLTRDLVLSRGIFFYGFAGLGTFVRHTTAVYNSDPSVQAGLGFRRNIVGPLYVRGDVGWTGAFLKDSDPADPYYDRTLTHHFDGALTLSVLFDN